MNLRHGSSQVVQHGVPRRFANRAGLTVLAQTRNGASGSRSIVTPSLSQKMTCKELLDKKKRMEHPDAYRDDIDTVQYCFTNDNVDELKGSVKIKKQWGLPVLNMQGNLVGVVTKHDLNTKDGVFVEEVMSSPVVAAHTDDTVSWAKSLMDKHKVKRVPVIDSRDGHCVGMICWDEIISPAARSSGDLLAEQGMMNIDM